MQVLSGISKETAVSEMLHARAGVFFMERKMEVEELNLQSKSLFSLL